MRGILHKEKTIKIFLAGGFGNNLFQICLGEYLKTKGLNVKYNSALTKKNIFTTFFKWKLHDNKSINQILINNVENKLSIIDIIYLSLVLVGSRMKIINLRSNNYNSIFFGRAFGYWQRGPHLSQQIFRVVSEKFMSTIDMDSEMLNKIVCTNALHVRRGDFNESRILGFDYYFSAVNLMQEKKMIVVSDDPSVCEVFKCKFRNVEFVCSRDLNLDDFLILFFSETLIMSNSTYCYWASQLGRAKSVIYPDKLENYLTWDLPIFNPIQKIVESNFK